MSISIASAILRGTWLIDPAIAKTQLPILDNVLNGKTKFDRLSDEEKKALEPVNYLVQEDSSGKTAISVKTVGVIGANGAGQAGDVKTKTVQVIPVLGVMLKYSEECGPIGTTDIAKRIENANSNPNIDAIVIKIDSPGGMVDGTQTLTDAIKNTSKPVVAFIDDGMACSAGYWVASACNEIIASQETDVIGSIGVYVTLADFKKHYESKGLPIHEIYSDLSSEKNKNYQDAMNGDYKGIKKNMLNPIAEKFISSVKENRAGKIDTSVADPFKGDTYMALRAIEIGLIDSVGSFNSAIQKAADLAQSNKSESGTNQNSSQSTNNDMKIKLASTHTFLASVLGVSFAQGETEKEIDLTADNITAIESALKTSADNLATATTAKAALEGEKATLTTQLATANAEITRLGTQAGQMGADPNAKGAEGAAGAGANNEFLSDADKALTALKAELGFDAK